MAYIDFKGIVKKVILKPDGDVEVVLTASGAELKGKVEGLHEMIAGKVAATLDSMMVTYNVEMNARTNKPIRHYKVDEKGVVSEAKPEGEQVEMNLEGLPKEQIPITTEKVEADKDVIDEFIIAGLAPSYEDFPYEFSAYVQRIRSGETYLKIANELEMSSGRVAEIFDEYRARVAPLAAKWDEWNKGKAQPGTVEFEDDGQDETDEEVDKEELEKFILEHRPTYDDLPIDFPGLLEERLNKNVTWRELANKVGLTSGQFSARWSKYKERVVKQMKENGGAA